MEFFDEFLKSNQKENVSIAQFLFEYDISHSTIYSLTQGCEDTLIKILQKVLESFLFQCNVSHIPQVSKKIEYLLHEYIIYIAANNINIALRRVTSFLRENHPVLYAKYTLHFADALWKYIGTYDTDYNFTTRRIKLAKMVNAKIS
jgi:hypothetical protein